MKIKIKRFVYYTSIAGCLFLSGCSSQTSCFDCSPPSVTLDELKLNGVTIVPDGHLFPKSASEKFVSVTEDSSYVSANLDLLFAPVEKYENIENPSDYVPNIRSTDTYRVVYSIDNQGEFISIEGDDTWEEGDESLYFTPTNPTLSYYYDPISPNGVAPWSHLIIGHPIFRVPSSATHVELWFRENIDVDYSLVTRTPLVSLTAWRDYIKPLID